MAKTPNRWYTIIAGLLLLTLAGFVAWGIIKIWLLFWDYISHSKPEIGAAIIAGSFTLLISVLSVVLSRWLDRNKERSQRRWEIEQEIRQQHLQVYQELVEFLFKVFQASKTGVSMPEDETNKFFLYFTQKILLWGSDRFLKDFSTFRDSSIQHASYSLSSNDIMTMMLALENLLYSIRADWGHDNKGLGKGDLLTLFITDIREYMVK